MENLFFAVIVIGLAIGAYNVFFKKTKTPSRTYTGGGGSVGGGSGDDVGTQITDAVTVKPREEEKFLK